MRNDDKSDGDSGEPSSWVGHKERGKRRYEEGKYELALESFRAALSSPEYNNNNGGGCPPPRLERQLLLSNVVACRLKIGGPAQARAAVEDAKRCVELNPSWSKGHVRLASAYLALGEPGHSNEACNCLQTALRYDPGNSAARSMLVRELRRDHRHASAAAAAASTSTSSPPPPPVNPGYVPTDDAAAASSRTTSSSSTSRPDDIDTDHPYFRMDDGNGDNNNGGGGSSSNRRYNRNNNNYGDGGDDIDDALTWRDRVGYAWGRGRMWYDAQTDATKTWIKVGLALLAMYVAFGGRFGMEYLFGGGGGTSYRGHYGADNPYDRYRNDRQRQTSSSSSYFYGDNYGPSSSSSYYSSGHRGRSSSSFGLHSLFDGSATSMAILAAILYGCHRAGINPWQALFFANLAAGRRGGMMRRRHRGYGGMGYGGMGYGYGGGGGGGMRFGRPRGGWY